MRNPTSPTITSEPILFVLWFRERRPRARWKKIGRFATRAEALTNCRGSGDFHIAELRDPELAGSTSATPSKP